MLFYRRLPYRYLVLPCLVYGGLMFLTTAKNTSLNYTYVSSLLPPLFIASAGGPCLASVDVIHRTAARGHGGVPGAGPVWNILGSVPSGRSISCA